MGATLADGRRAFIGRFGGTHSNLHGGLSRDRKNVRQSAQSNSGDLQCSRQACVA
jgi:hypothetical protein